MSKQSKSSAAKLSTTASVPSGTIAAGCKARALQRRRLAGLLVFSLAVFVSFWPTLVGVADLALQVTLHSHILLIPFVSAYLLWIRRRSLSLQDSPPSPLPAMLLFVAACATWTTKWFWALQVDDYLSLMALTLVTTIIGGGFLFLGQKWMRAAAFPVAFLLFAVPLPPGMVEALEHASKLASSECADLLFSLSGMTYLRDATTFVLPGVRMTVAQECSGIRSSLVLVITGAFAANLLLRTAWRRWLLTFFVIPLGILRNGFRIWTLGYLSVHMGPQILDSDLHHRGGPIFFVLSLIPLLAFVWWLRHSEAKAERDTLPSPVPAQ